MPLLKAKRPDPPAAAGHLAGPGIEMRKAIPRCNT
jgi:hypothetical protein